MNLLAALLAEKLVVADRRDITARSGVPSGIIKRAAGKRPVSADHFLRLCAVTGLDPMTGQDTTPHMSAGELDRNSLAMAIRMNMTMKDHSIRQGAISVDIAPTIFHRLRNGELTAVEGVLAGCRYIGLHPFGYLHPVSRETNAGTDVHKRSAA